MARTLTLEIRLRRVGFAVFEGSNRLLDWGIRRWRPDANPASTIVRRIGPLLCLYSPSVVVLKNVGHADRARPRRRVITAVRRKLIRLPVEVHVTNGDDIRPTFRQTGNQNKYLIALAIAEIFPELRRKVPPKRKAWQPERYNAVIFDAVALALTHSARCEACLEQTKADGS